MVPLYILGILQRYGPQHGYQIKKIIAEQLSDFTKIKLPTIYYHLEKMEKEGFLLTSSEKSGARPEKTVYSLTEKGIEVFQKKLVNLLKFDYSSMFPTDGVFFFSEYLKPCMITKSLKDYIEKLNKTINYIKVHRDETIQFVPEDMRVMVNIIFNHHIEHYQAELVWAEKSLNLLKEEE